MDKEIRQKLFYPKKFHGQLVYKNKKNIHNNDELRKETYRQSAVVADYLLANPKYVHSINALYSIHYMMFHHFFSWAGEIRTIDLQDWKYRGSQNPLDWFALIRQFPQVYKDINMQIAKIQSISKPKKVLYAKLLDTVTEYHPFWNGNGRATKVLLQMLALNHHQHLEYIYDGNKMTKALHDGNIKLIMRLLVLKNE